VILETLNVRCLRHLQARCLRGGAAVTTPIVHPLTVEEVTEGMRKHWALTKQRLAESTADMEEVFAACDSIVQVLTDTILEQAKTIVRLGDRVKTEEYAAHGATHQRERLEAEVERLTAEVKRLRETVARLERLAS
jgi:hypothetical protein